ncbi:hypothetical protein UFOVP134_36 [uncultured Caudovirales phage]|uniref:Uncharacterized protein n=1 Tax=uncultured Caudovirales phage TaxID=2100421 RepID=A0A6J5LFT8_9CAUD|nr:hypothetical protein UFOVP134_36 [uncultured Caudovirales phage]
MTKTAFDWLKASRGYREERITRSRILEAVQADTQYGLCCSCGRESEDYVEPDACGYTCSSCGRDAVFGYQEILIEVAA